MTVSAVKILPMDSAFHGKRPLSIWLYIEYLLFRRDACSARDIRLAKLIADKYGADWYVHPEATEFVEHALAGGSGGPPKLPPVWITD